MPELIRCDSALLPFKSSSIDAIHAGAAMHCWQNVEQSLTEVYRVLKPGGRFYATTFIDPTIAKLLQFEKVLFKRHGLTIYASADDIRETVKWAGFDGQNGSCHVRKEGSHCVVVKAKMWVKI